MMRRGTQSGGLRRAGLVSESFADGRVVYDERTHAAHSLGSDVAAVWDLCDGRRTPEEIAGVLALDPELVRCALYELERCDLLEPETSPIADGIGALRLDRRAMLKRAAVVGGGTALIATVFVPPAFAIGSNGITFTVTGTAGSTITGTSSGSADMGNPQTATVAYPSAGANYIFCDTKGTVTTSVGSAVPPSSGGYVEFDYGFNENVTAINTTATSVSLSVTQNGAAFASSLLAANGGSYSFQLGSGQGFSATFT